MSAPMNIQHRRTPSNYYAPQPTHARSLSGQFGSSWSDAFEFSSHSPLNSALHLGASSPPMGSTHLSSSYSSMTTSALGLSSTSMCAPLSMSCSPGTAQKDYFSFERDYCSNFACCGITLPDMHALVAHFEETHLNTAENAPFTTQCGPAPSFAALPAQAPHSKLVPQVNMINTSLGVPGTAPGDAPSPHSSVGPETPPPASHVPSYAFSQPQLQVQTQIYSSRTNSVSPYAASPLSAGSPGSSGAEHSDGSGSGSGSQGGEMDMDIDMDVLMHFDPLDGGVHTPLDSTPPSPLAPPVRPASVLRAAALKNTGAPDVPPVGFPPALFSAPALHSTSAEKDSKRKDKKEKRSRAASPSVDVGCSSSGGAIRREKIRKTASGVSSLLGLGAGCASRLSLSSTSSDEPSSGAEGAERSGKEGGESVEGDARDKSEKVGRTERNERIGRPERTDKGGKRTREKAYKCTKSGCTKSYLNPNGLKYHLAKGTCTFVDGPPTPVTPTTPSIPPIPSINASRPGNHSSLIFWLIDRRSRVSF